MRDGERSVFLGLASGPRWCAGACLGAFPTLGGGGLQSDAARLRNTAKTQRPLIKKVKIGHVSEIVWAMRDHREARARLLHQAIPKRIESRNNGMPCGAVFCADIPKAPIRCSDIGLPHTAWRKGGASCAHRQHRSSPAQTAQQEHCDSCRIRLAQAIHAQGLRKTVCGRSGGESCTYA